MSRYLIPGLILTAALLCGTAWFVSRAEKRQPAPPIIRLLEPDRSVYFLPQYVALAENFFREEGVTVVLETVTSGNLLDELAAGRGDVALVGLDTLLFYHATGKTNFSAFAALTRREGSFLLAREKPDSFFWTDLKGRRLIAPYPDSTGGIVLEGVLREHGLVPHRDLTMYQNIPPAFRPGVFKSGSGDYLLAEEPVASELESRKEGVVVASLGLAGGEMPCSVYVATGDFLDQNVEAARRFTGGIYRAMLWVNQQGPAASARVARKWLNKTSPAVLSRAVERYYKQKTWATTPAIFIPLFNRFQELMLMTGELPRPVEFHSVVNDRLARKVVEQKSLTN